MDRIVAVIGALAMTAGLLGLAGCTKSPSAVSAAPPPAAAAAQDAAPPEHESWEVYRMQGKRIGYGNATVRRTVEGGQSVVLTESVNHLAVKRAGQLTEEDIRGQSTETPEGACFVLPATCGLAPRRSARRAEFTATGWTSRAGTHPPVRRRKARSPGLPTAAGRWRWNRRFGSGPCGRASNASSPR